MSKKIIIEGEGLCIHDVRGVPRGMVLVVRDSDTDGLPESDIVEVEGEEVYLRSYAGDADWPVPTLKELLEAGYRLGASTEYLDKTYLSDLSDDDQEDAFLNDLKQMVSACEVFKRAGLKPDDVSNTLVRVDDVYRNAYEEMQELHPTWVKSLPPYLNNPPLKKKGRK